jgi:hypothetical protein
MTQAVRQTQNWASLDALHHSQVDAHGTWRFDHPQVAGFFTVERTYRA